MPAHEMPDAHSPHSAPIRRAAGTGRSGGGLAVRAVDAGDAGDAVCDEWVSNEPAYFSCHITTSITCRRGAYLEMG